MTRATRNQETLVNAMADFYSTVKRFRFWHEDLNAWEAYYRECDEDEDDYDYDYFDDWYDNYDWEVYGGVITGLS